MLGDARGAPPRPVRERAERESHIGRGAVGAWSWRRVGQVARLVCQASRRESAPGWDTADENRNELSVSGREPHRVDPLRAELVLSRGGVGENAIELGPVAQN